MKEHREPVNILFINVLKISELKLGFNSPGHSTESQERNETEMCVLRDETDVFVMVVIV